MAGDNDQIFEQLSLCTWTVDGGETLPIPVYDIQETGGNRLVQRERPYRDGAKLDDTGSKARTFALTALFNNTIIEPGMSLDRALYPTVLDLILDSFATHKTGALELPTRGLVRCRASTYRRAEKCDQRDTASLTFDFIEDNEDNIDAQKFKARTVNASMKWLVEMACDTAQAAGKMPGSLADLREFASGLEAIANYPGSTVTGLDNQVSRVFDVTNDVLNAFLKADKSNSELAADPKLANSERKLMLIQDTAASARRDARNGRPTITNFVVGYGCTIFDVAALTNQRTEDLLDLNANLNPFFIPAGSKVKLVSK